MLLLNYLNKIILCIEQFYVTYENYLKKEMCYFDI